MTVLIDWLLNCWVALANWLLRRIYPFLRSRSGRANPAVRHIVSQTYLLREAWLVQPNGQQWHPQHTTLFPVIVQVQTINRCNAACDMCPYPYTIHLQTRQVMDDALYEKIITECAQEPTFQALVPMSKNEPLLDVKLEDRIAAFKRLAQPHQVVEIVTNGTALTPQRFARLVESGLDLLTISLSALNRATFERFIHGIAFEQVLRHIEAVAQSPLLPRINVFLRYVVQHGNEGELAAFQQQWQQRGLNVAHYEVSNRAGSLHDYEAQSPAKSFLFRRFRLALGRQLFQGRCPYAFGILHVLANGDVPLCANDWDNRDVLGNVQTQSLRAIYNSPRLNELRALMVQGRYAEIAACKDCSFWREWLS